MLNWIQHLKKEILTSRLASRERSRVIRIASTATPQPPVEVFCSLCYFEPDGGRMRIRLSASQRRLLESKDSHGRVYASWSVEVAQLVRWGYLRENIYYVGCYWVCKTSDGQVVSR